MSLFLHERTSLDLGNTELILFWWHDSSLVTFNFYFWNDTQSKGFDVWSALLKKTKQNEMKSNIFVWKCSHVSVWSHVWVCMWMHTLCFTYLSLPLFKSSMRHSISVYWNRSLSGNFFFWKLRKWIFCYMLAFLGFTCECNNLRFCQTLWLPNSSWDWRNLPKSHVVHLWRAHPQTATGNFTGGLAEVQKKSGSKITKCACAWGLPNGEENQLTDSEN